jgi:hypothetical protein
LRPYGQENLLIDIIRKQTREVIMVNEPVIEAVMIGIQGQTSHFALLPNRIHM